MNYIYGPVQSRRLGASLGITATPFKYCLFDCIYCQLKKTTNFTAVRREYIKASAILAELEQFLKGYPDYKKIDYITLSGSGEPLLNSAIKDIILGIKKLSRIPVALITNSALLKDAEVRKDILDLDLIVPSLDAVTQDIFEKIDRPFDLGIKIADIIKALIELRKEFSGKIWLEIMIVKDINDDVEYVKKFKEVLKLIGPDKVQINIPSRPPSESWVKVPFQQKLKAIRSILGETCELI
jgi:wyosine [tRNA(Phe)-imidazoG37] synthetase (radical SAM superfamily)